MRRPVILLLTCLIVGVFGPGLAQEVRPPITPENASQVGLLATMGGSSATSLVWSADNATLYAAYDHTVYAFDADDLNTPVGQYGNFDCNTFGGCNTRVHLVDDEQLVMISHSMGVEFWSTEDHRFRSFYGMGMAQNAVYFEDRDWLFVPPKAEDEIRYLGLFLWRDEALDPWTRSDHDPYEYADIQFPFTNAYIYDFEASPDEQLGAFIDTSPQSREVYLFPIDKLEDFIQHQRPIEPVFTAPEAPILDLTFNANSTQLALMTPDSIVVINTQGDLVDQWSLHIGVPRQLAFHPNGSSLASVGQDGTLWLHDLSDTAENPDRLLFHVPVDLTSLAFSPDGSRIAVGGWNGDIWMIDVENGDVLNHYESPWWTMWDMKFSHDGTLLALAGDNGSVYIYDVIDQPPFLVNQRVLTDAHGPITGLDFSLDDSELAAASVDHFAYTWNTATWNLQSQTDAYVPLYDVAYTQFEGLLPIGNRTFSIAFNPVRSLLAVQEEQGIHIRRSDETTNRDTNGVVITPRFDGGYEGDIAWSNSGDYLAFWVQQTTFATIQLWRTDDLTAPERIFRGYAAAFSPDERLLASENLTLYNLETQDVLYQSTARNIKRPHRNYGFQVNEILPASSRALVFHPYGHLIFTAGMDGVIWVWGIPDSQSLALPQTQIE